MNALFLILLFTSNSCRKSSPLDCFKSTGKEITEARSSGVFDKISLNDNVNLVLKHDTIRSISVTGGKNVLKKVKTNISEGVLTIENQNSCNWVRSFDKEITVYVNIDTLRRIEYYGSGDINCSNTIISDSMQLDVWEGAGDINMKVNNHRNIIYFHIGTSDINYQGSSTLSYISLSSFGPIDARALETNFTYIGNSGSNNCYIWAHTKIDANINGLGNIYYKGDAEISLDLSGDGRLIKL